MPSQVMSASFNKGVSSSCNSCIYFSLWFLDLGDYRHLSLRLSSSVSLSPRFYIIVTDDGTHVPLVDVGSIVPSNIYYVTSLTLNLVTYFIPDQR